MTKLSDFLESLFHVDFNFMIGGMSTTQELESLRRIQSEACHTKKIWLPQHFSTQMQATIIHRIASSISIPKLHVSDSTLFHAPVKKRKSPRSRNTHTKDKKVINATDWSEFRLKKDFGRFELQG